jgi:hypothetical protein
MLPPAELARSSSVDIPCSLLAVVVVHPAARGLGPTGRIVIEGPRFVGLRLTPAAYRHGLALALPDAATSEQLDGHDPAATAEAE